MPETYTGNEGTEALSAGYSILDGNEDRRQGWLAINKTRDMLAGLKTWVQQQIAGIQLTWTAITGKPSTFPPSSHTHERVENGGYWFGWRGNGTFGTGDNVSVGANLGVDGTIYGADVRLTGGLYGQYNARLTDHLYVPAASAATSGYSVAYLNSDGRLSRGASAEKYKKYISAVDPAGLGDIWPEFVRYQMRSGDGSWKYGYIADRMAEHPDQAPFVVYAFAPDGNGELTQTDEVESIDFIALLLAQNAQLHQAVDLLEQRITALEAR